MLSKKSSRIVAVLMLVIAIGFLAFAFTHPTASFPWNNTVTYFIYIAYILAMIILFVAPFKKKG